LPVLEGVFEIPIMPSIKHRTPMQKIASNKGNDLNAAKPESDRIDIIKLTAHIPDRCNFL
jgi:hypothetical protein